MHTRYSCLMCGFLSIVLFTPEVSAHKLRVFATTTNGIDISGYAYAAGGFRLAGQRLQVADTNANKIAELITGANGEFTYTATSRADHIIILQTDDGHGASARVSAERLVGLSNAPLTSPLSPARIADAEAAAAVDENKARAEDKVRIRAIIGGIGYIAGFFGLLALWKTRTRRHRTTS